MGVRLELPESIEFGKIGIATVTFNSGRVLSDFFQSIRSQTYPNFTVYVVDNASTDDSVALCQEQGVRFRVFENRTNTGFAHATNIGIRQAIDDGCEAVLILNNDVIFDPDFLSTLMDGLKRHKADLVAPMTYYHDEPTIIWAAGGKLQKFFGYRPIHLGMHQEDTGQFSSDRRIEFAPGSCILANRTVFSTIGLFDELFFTYWEDTDFAVRALKAGLHTYLISNARMWHKVSSLTGMNSPFQRYYAVRNHALYIRKHCTRLATALLSMIYLGAYRLSGLRKRATDPRIAAWNEGLELAETALKEGRWS